MSIKTVVNNIFRFSLVFILFFSFSFTSLNADINEKDSSDNFYKKTKGIPSSWAAPLVNKADELNIIPVDLKNYQNQISRREFCYIVNNYFLFLLNLSHDEYLSKMGIDINKFNYTDTDDYQVRFASAVGIINGVGGSRFNPEGTLTREEAATILSRLRLKINSKPCSYTPTPFVDRKDISGWALEFVDMMSEEKVIVGYPDGTFRPKDKLTVEQSIVLTMRLSGKS